jgi:hypothetical protein
MLLPLKAKTNSSVDNSVILESGPWKLDGEAYAMFSIKKIEKNRSRCKKYSKVKSYE